MPPRRTRRPGILGEMAACPRPRRAVFGMARLGSLAMLLAGCGASTPATTRVASPPAAPPALVAPAQVDTAAAAAAGARRARRARARSLAARAHAVSPGAVAPAHPVPAAFRIAAGAPSDAQVRSELHQMYQVQHAALSAASADLAGLLPWTRELKTNRVSVASVFRDYGLGLACGGVLGRQQIGVAHKTAPCGTIIAFSYAGRTLEVPVIDRGPYIAGREWDLTGATAQALGFPGLGQISWSALSRPGSGATH